MAKYEIPEVLTFVREQRAAAGGPLATGTLSPSQLWEMCSDGQRSEGVVRALYNHAFIEAGWIGEQPEPNFKPFRICPVCGYVFDEEAT